MSLPDVYLCGETYESVVVPLDALLLIGVGV